MSKTKYTSHVFGALDIINHQDLNNSRISGLGTPLLPDDAVTKSYVDNSIIGNNLSSGIGINVNTVANTININPVQTSITTLGTIQNGTWNGNTIQITYGGTGVTNFSSNKLIYYNGSNQLVSSQDLTIDSTKFSTNVPINILNSSDTIMSLSTVGSLIILGGVNIAKQLYIGGNAKILGNMTVGNITINGNVSLSTITAINANFTSISTSSLNSNTMNLISYIVTPLTSTSNLITNSSTISNLTSTNNTFNNLIILSNLTSGNINAGLATFSTTNSTNISTGQISFLNGTCSNIVSTNSSMSSLRVSNLSTVLNSNITNSTINNVNIQNTLTTPFLNSTIIISTNGNFSNITNSNLLNINSTITNILLTNTTTSNLSVLNTVNSTVISTGSLYISNNLSSSNISNINITNVNQTNKNIITTNATINSLKVIGNTSLTIVNLTTLTASSLFINNFLNSTYNIFVGVTSNNLNVSGLSIFSTTNSFSTSTGSLFSLNSINNNSSIGILNVSGNINNSNGTIYTTNITSNNLYASNLINSLNIISINNTCSNFNSLNITCSNLNSLNTNSTNITCNNVNTFLTNALNLISTNQTTTNLLNTNISSNNIKSTSASIGNCYIVNNSISNTYITNSSITNLLITKNMSLSSSYQGGVITTAGSFFNISPSTFTNNVTTSGGSASSWYGNYIASATLVASNSSVITNKASNLYIQSNVILGANQTVNYNSSLLMGYVQNITGGNLNTQISFERADGNTFAGIYTENVTNRLIIINASLSGGSGLGIYTIKDTPIVYSSIPSSTNITPTPYIQLLNSSSNFYSTIDSNSITTGTIIISGGLGVSKNITSTSASINNLITTNISSNNLNINGNIILNNGYITNTGYLLNTLSVSSYSTGMNNLIFNTSPIINSRITIINNTFGNIITFQDPGVYQLNVKLHSNTTTTSPTLLQTHLNIYTAGNWIISQSSSLNTIFDSNTDFDSKFMLYVDASQICKFTLNNGYTSNFTFDTTLQWSRLMINRIG